MEEKCKKAFEDGKNLAKTGKLPEIPTADEFKELCEKAEHYDSGFTIENLTEYLTQLLDREHNYNTIAEAIIAGLRASLKAMDRHPNAGITGFQHGWIVHHFLHKELSIKGPAQLLKYEDMLYPQYRNHFEKTITEDTWKYLQDAAKKRLEETNGPHPNVKAHWEAIVEGKIPFGYSINTR